jgi:hypothetical protein
LLALVFFALLAASEAREVSSQRAAFCVDVNLGFHRRRMYLVIVEGRDFRRDSQT